MLTSTLDFREVENLVAGIEERLAHNPPTTSAGAMHLLYLAPFAALSQPVRRSLAALVERDLPLPEPAQVRARGRPLRIGYVSGHLGDHPVGHVMSGLFEAHDRNRVHVTVFCDQDRSYEQGEYFERVRDGVDQMVFIQDLDDDKAAARIRAEAIDILIDINGYMRPIRVGLFARRPAPVQIYWMGHGGALGLSCHDFVIGDRAVIDDAEAAGYRERVIRLPVSFHAADRQAVDAEVPTRVECGLPPEGHVLCAFNHPRKIDRMAANAWMQILRDIPGSVLWLSRGPFPERALQNLSALAQAHKVDPKRLILADRIQDKRRHLSRHRLASLFLDTFRFSASATGVDALLAGLPIVTRRGSSFHSNIGTSLVHAAGLPDLIAEDTEDYIRIACGLLRSPDRLAEVRSRLEDGRASTLFGTKRLARNLEDVFEAVSRRPVADQPRMIEIT